MYRKILRLPAVKELTGLSRSAIYRRMQANLFPHQVSLGGRSVGWVEEDVLAWIAARVEERDSRIQ